METVLTDLLDNIDGFTILNATRQTIEAWIEVLELEDLTYLTHLCQLHNLRIEISGDVDEDVPKTLVELHKR